MLLFAVLVLCLEPRYISSQFSSFRGVTSRASTFSTEENHVLNGYRITSQRTYDILACTQACLSVAQCKSFNFENLPHGSCEMSSESKQSLGQKAFLVYRRGFVYGEMQNVSDPVFPPEPTPSVPVAEYHFTTLGFKGKDGPGSTLGYMGTSLEGKVNLSSGKQLWSVLTTGTYVIEAYGASGTNGTCTAGSAGCVIGGWKLGGLGAKIVGTFTLNKDDELQILVGQEGKGTRSFATQAGVGGGGTFVVLANTLKPLIVAGGGGGGGQSMAGFTDGDPGQASVNGSQCGGVNEGGGRFCDASLQEVQSGVVGGAGAGFTGNGVAMMQPAQSYKNGGAGGKGPDSEGGFGGGGFGMGNGGGGGGYCGGGVVGDSSSGTAGGGGSYNIGTSQGNTAGVNKGSGKVVIKMF